MLKKPCPYHQGLVKHTLEECTMLRHYYAKLGLPNTFMIFGGPSACLMARQRKKEHREVFSVKVATPRYLN